MTEAVPKPESVKDDPKIREGVRAVETDQIAVLTYLDQLRPLQRSQPFVIRWENAWPLLEALWHSPIKEDPRAGKIVAFYSKATGELLGTTPTMVGGFQIIPPKDRGMAHKHSMASLLYAVSGHGYSVVDGKKYDWDAGDVVTFPAWSMHEHGNRDNRKPAIVFQVLDLPLIKAMRVLEMRELAGGYQKITDGEGTQELGAKRTDDGFKPDPAVLEKIKAMETEAIGLLPYSEQLKPPQSVESCFFPWNAIEPVLDALLKSPAHSEGEEKSLLLYSKRTGELKGTTPTLAASFQVIPPGIRLRAHRHTAATIQYVVQGKGYLVADGVRHDWGKGDMVVFPGGSVHEEGSRDEHEPAILFGISDLPLVIGMRIMYTQV
jgi:gentisate 1,2-dioxygenase